MLIIIALMFFELFMHAKVFRIYEGNTKNQGLDIQTYNLSSLRISSGNISVHALY